MNQEYITYLKTTYPDIITKDQLYRICHVSKKTASFLLDSGLIPNENSGKKTRKYKIRLDDVIEYLKDREVNPISYKAPDNYYKGNYSAKKKVAVPSFSEDQVNALRKFLTDQLVECDDVISIETINEFIGYSTKSIYEWYHKGYIKGFLIASEEVYQWDISTPSVQNEVKTVETEKIPVQPKPSEQSQNVSKQTEPEIVIEIPTAPEQVQPKTEPVQVTQNYETTLPSTEPEPTIPVFDIEYWITYAKNYAVSIGFELSPAAVECWDNPMIAGPQCKYLERDIANCLNRYKNIEGFTGVWIWAEPDGKGAYKLYIGYE